MLQETLRTMAEGQHTFGSHVDIYNYKNFGNLYTTGPKDFFVRKELRTRN